MSVGIKSRCGNGVRREKQAVTNQARQEKPRPGFPGRSCTSSVAATRHKPTATSHGCSRRRRDLGRGRRTSSCTTVTISTHATHAETGKTRTTPEKIIFLLDAGRETTRALDHNSQTAGSGSVLCVSCCCRGAFGTWGVGYPTPTAPSMVKVRGVATPRNIPYWEWRLPRRWAHERLREAELVRPSRGVGALSRYVEQARPNQGIRGP